MSEANMTTNELRVLSIIWDWGGEASVDTIARETGFSIDYARLLSESLARENCIDFLYSKLCKIKRRGKLAAAGKESQGARKILIPQKSTKFGLGKNKKGKFILNYG